MNNKEINHKLELVNNEIKSLQKYQQELIDQPSKTLLDSYKEFRDSDILEGHDEGILLAFLYYLKRGNLEGKSFNPNYEKNAEEDVLSKRLKELEKLYKN